MNCSRVTKHRGAANRNVSRTNEASYVVGPGQYSCPRTTGEARFQYVSRQTFAKTSS